ncbi:LamG domain-containing protein, partial [Streptomyces asoensis]
MGIGVTPVTAAVAAAPTAPTRTKTTAGNGAATTQDALAEAKRSGRSVEVGSLRSESSDVYATPDGNLEAREYLRPVRTRVGGEWKPVDTDLVKTSEGTVAPGATTVGLEFSGGGDAPLVRMEKAGRELALSWPGELPAPVLDGATATYRDVLPDVDLRMGAQEDGFTQLLVVKSAEAAADPELTRLRLKLSADGIDVRETSEGGLEAVDEGAGSAVFEAPKPVMWDSSTREPAQRDEAPPASAPAGNATPEGKASPAQSATPEGKASPAGKARDRHRL